MTRSSTGQTGTSGLPGDRAELPSPARPPDAIHDPNGRPADTSTPQPRSTGAPEATGVPAGRTAAAAEAAARAALGSRAGQVRPQTQPSPAASVTVQFRIPPAPPSSAPPAPPRFGRLRLFPALRVVCWQLAVVLFFFAIGWSWPMVTVAAVVSAALLAVTATVVRGRWLSSELGLRLGLAARRRKRLLPEHDTAAALVRLLAPGAGLHTAELAGSTAGVVCRAEELVAVLRPLDCMPDALARMALAGGLLPEDDPAAPAVRLRLLLHRSPRRPGTPAQQARVWLVIGVQRDSDFPSCDDLAVSLSNAVGRVRRKLRASGIDAVPLSDDELAATLTSLSHLAQGGRYAVREQWRYWRAGPISQAGLRIRGLDAHPGAARLQFVYQLNAALATDVAVTTALSCTTEPDAIVRVASPTDAAVDAAAQALSWAASMSGARLVRMNGQHAFAVAASLPIGGKPR